MRLQKAQIRDFWCIDDSGEFSLDSVTCLVGKNESGKTAILKALNKIKPEDQDGEQFQPARDYPKRKWRPDTPVPDSPSAISTEWQIEKEALASLEERFGTGVLTKTTFGLTKSYNNTRTYAFEVDEAKVLAHMISSAGLSPEERKVLPRTAALASLKRQLETISPRSPNQEKLLQSISTQFPNGVDRAVMEAIDAALPTFLYFDQYLKLPGIVSIEQLLQRKGQNRLTDGDRVFLALLALAGTSIETIHGASTFEAFNSSLRAVSNQISDQIFHYWTQNRHLDVEIRVDHARAQDPAPYNTGFVVRTRVNNRRHRADTSFDERSTGFVWFFSFLVWFYRLRETYKGNLVILLDEPGLSLHARAQADLLRYINEQLRPSYQVIYTTHSPFMIDPDHLLSARTVEDVVVKDGKTGEDTLLGTKVSADVLSTDPDTVSPLQRALDYEMTQTLFIGRHTLLLEGPSDLLYLKWFSRQAGTRHKADIGSALDGRSGWRGRPDSGVRIPVSRE